MFQFPLRGQLCCDIVVGLDTSEIVEFQCPLLSVSEVIKGPASPISEGRARYPFPLPADARAKREAERASGQSAS